VSITHKTIGQLRWASIVTILILGALFANGPEIKISETRGTVIGAANYNDKGGTRIHIYLDSGADIYLRADIYVGVQYNERVMVEVWSRRFIGYKTIYKKL
jgi:hypothetical protein